MSVTIGTTATSEEIKARWAFSEIPSPRFGPSYRGHGPSHLHDLAHGGEPFEKVPPADWPHLLEMISKHGRNEGFVSNIDTLGGATFTCTAWHLSDLMNSHVLPTFGNVSYPVFLTQNPSIVLAGGSPRFDSHDPRAVASSIDPGVPFVQREPCIVIRYGGHDVLIEGYLRSLLWLRKNDPATPLLVWLPN
ncbi:hypothetical protein AAFX91_41460 [Bradyrhizobium sp. 31Argb]|uniref:hypothetical protein n=1 Tax=unclassified Bradyrhizobium TaxID=2631580 RepID=UPI00102E6D00|nr:hypothetical protein [Bradyrhizobium sp. Leo170]TAI62692.1 hypothetical protein CWO89_28410 [Bradyrhizobium sp. Leo170]